jgi:hypothetical protein
MPTWFSPIPGMDSIEEFSAAFPLISMMRDPKSMRFIPQLLNYFKVSDFI